MNSAVALIPGLASISTVTAQEPQMPAPGPEQKAISAFAGKWSFEGMVPGVSGKSTKSGT